MSVTPRCRIEETIEALYEGTATPEDVYSALGWEVHEHGRWWRRKAICRPGERLEGMSRVTEDVNDALYLIDYGRAEDAMREALALNRPLENPGSARSLARRICIVALTRVDLRREPHGLIDLEE